MPQHAWERKRDNHKIRYRTKITERIMKKGTENEEILRKRREKDREREREKKIITKDATKNERDHDSRTEKMREALTSKKDLMRGIAWKETMTMKETEEIMGGNAWLIAWLIQDAVPAL